MPYPAFRIVFIMFTAIIVDKTSENAQYQKRASSVADVKIDYTTVNSTSPLQ